MGVVLSWSDPDLLDGVRVRQPDRSITPALTADLGTSSYSGGGRAVDAKAEGGEEAEDYFKMQFRHKKSFSTGNAKVF
jgi:hypothetical protein